MRALFFLILILLQSPVLAFDMSIFAPAKTAVVSIEGRANHAAYSDTGKWTGTGFLVSKARGIILTNRHVVGPAATSSHDVSFNNGKEVEAVLIYTDPTNDFAFLKIDPKKIPEDSVELKFSETDLQLGDGVVIVGKNEGQSFSAHIGRVSSLYEDPGFFHVQSFRISLNAQGGSSGSPVLNEKGEVVGLVHSSNLSSSAFAYPIRYCKDALSYLVKDEKPPRLHTGMIARYHSLDRMNKYSKFPQKLVKEYRGKYPDSLNKAPVVSRILKDTPADGVLKPGDVIWEVNNREVGPDLHKLDRIIDESGDKPVTFTIYRQGKVMKAKMPTYDLHKQTLQRMVDFGGATFYETNHTNKFISGAPYGSVFVSNIRPGTSFHAKFPAIGGTTKLFINITSVNNVPIKSLDDLIKIIPDLVKQEFFTITYVNYAFHMGHSGIPLFARHDSIQEIKYDPLDGDPSILKRSPKTHTWEIVKIK